MQIHTDLNLRVIANTTDMPWASSPVNGIDRKTLERVGEEIARATSLVRFLDANDPIRQFIEIANDGPSTDEWLTFTRGEEWNKP
jgi:hypothetical protein